jgi:hypothetical protein
MRKGKKLLKQNYLRARDAREAEDGHAVFGLHGRRAVAAEIPQVQACLLDQEPGVGVEVRTMAVGSSPSPALASPP